MGIGPVPAIRELLRVTGMTLKVTPPVVSCICLFLFQLDTHARFVILSLSWSCLLIFSSSILDVYVILVIEIVFLFLLLSLLYIKKNHIPPCSRSHTLALPVYMCMQDIDLVEINEAFAPQVIACARDLQLDFAK